MKQYSLINILELLQTVSNYWLLYLTAIHQWNIFSKICDIHCIRNASEKYLKMQIHRHCT